MDAYKYFLGTILVGTDYISGRGLDGGPCGQYNKVKIKLWSIVRYCKTLDFVNYPLKQHHLIINYIHTCQYQQYACQSFHVGQYFSQVLHEQIFGKGGK